MPHTYIGVEVLSMTVGQRQTLIDAIRALLPERDAQPCWRVHHRMRPDNNAAIIEAFWKSDDVTNTSLIRYFANAFDVATGTISSTTNSTIYGRVLTLIHSGIQRVRFIAFGGVGASWEESRQAVLAYLSANLPAWE